MIKLFSILSMIFISNIAFAETFKCSFKDMEGNSGRVTVSLKDSYLSAKLNGKTYSAENCIVDRTMASEVMATCDEDSGTGMGLMLKSSRGKREGYLVIEELSFFAELDC